jgi:hypothetical protein
MNRFFRSALFPLIIIAALVWLALQTLGAHGTKTQPATLYQVMTRIRTDPASIDHAIFVPSKQELDVYQTTGAGGKKIVVHYAGDQSQAQIRTCSWPTASTSTRRASEGIHGGRSSPRSCRSSCCSVSGSSDEPGAGGGSKVMSFGKSRQSA